MRLFAKNSGLVMIELRQHGEFQIAVRGDCPGRSSSFLAWAVRGKISAHNPLEEPWDIDVWFEFGRTADDAVEKLIKDLPK